MAGIPAGRLNIEIVAEIARLQSDLDKAKRAVNAASKDIAASARHANDNLGGMASSIGKAGNQSKLANHHLANLSYQFQDIAVSLQGGQKPMTVFLQQGSQIAQIMAQAGVGVGGLAGAVGTMALNFAKAHPLLVAAGVAVGALIGAFQVLATEINKNSEVTVTWQDTALGAFDVVSDAVSEKVTAAFEAMGIDVGEVWKSIVQGAKLAGNLMIGALIAVPKAVRDTYDKLPAAFGDAFYSAANIAIRALNTLVKASAAPLNAIIGAFNQAFGTTIPQVVLGGIEEIANPYKGALSALGSAGAKSMAESLGTDWIKYGADALSDAAQKRARLRKAAEGAGKDIGKSAGKAAGAAAAKEMVDEWAEALGRNLDAFNKAFVQIQKASERLLGDELAADQAKALDDIAKGMSAEAKAAIEAAEANERFNDQLRRTIGYLDQIGGLGATLGNIGAIFEAMRPDQNGNYNFSAVRGPVGGFLGLFAETDDGKKFIRNFTDTLDDFFGGAGKFTQTLTNVFRGFGIGGAIGGVAQAAGLGKTASKGAAIGGGLAAGVGALASSGALGFGGAQALLATAGGPIGIAAGAIVGILASTLLKSTPRGSATFDSTGIVSSRGNSKDFIEQSTGIGSGIVAALNDIAGALGATLNDFRFSVGVRDGNLRYDPTGQGITKTGNGALNFGKDDAALAERIISDAFAKGAFGGLSEGVSNFLKTGAGELESRIQDVLSLRGIQAEAAQMRDPQGFELGALDKWREKALEIATAVGEGVADIEYLYGERRKEIVEKYSEEAASAIEIANQKRALEIQIMQLSGQETEALAAARELEKEGVDESLRPLYDRIYALQDEATAAAETARIMQERQGLETRLLQLQGDTAALRERERATLDPSNQALFDRIVALEDEKTALDAANATASRIADERLGLETRLMTALGDTNGLRERERNAIDAANRSFYDYVLAVEATKAANDNAAAAVRTRLAEAETLNTRYLQLVGNTAQLRVNEMEATDPANRSLLQLIYTLEDAKVAADAAAAAQDKLNATNGRIRDLEIQQQALTDPAGADYAQLIETLKGIEDPREKQATINLYNAQKQAAKAQAANDNSNAFVRAAEGIKSLREANDNFADAAAEQAQRIADARGALTQAYERERSELVQTAEEYRRLGDTLREFRDSLFSRSNGFDDLAALRQRFGATSSLANQGNRDALAGLPGDATAYLDAFRDTTRTRTELQLEVMRVARAVEQAAGAADAEVSDAERQIERLDRMVEGFTEIKEEIRTTNQALADLKAELANKSDNQARLIGEGNRLLRNLDDNIDNVTDGGIGMRNQEAA